MRLIGFGVRAHLQAVEDVVGRVVDEHRARPRRLRRDQANSRGVDEPGVVRLRLGAVDGRVGGGVDDHVRPLPLEESDHALGPFEVG